MESTDSAGCIMGDVVEVGDVRGTSTVWGVPEQEKEGWAAFRAPGDVPKDSQHVAGDQTGKG